MGGGGDNADTPVERERGFVNVDGLRCDNIALTHPLHDPETNKRIE